MRTFLAVLFICCAPIVVAEEKPVTQTEASAIFAHAERVILNVVQVPRKPAAYPAGAGTATREEILKHFLALYEVVKPKFKFTPPARKAAANVISVKEPQVRRIAEKLETLGFVDPYGPLVASKSEGLSPREFGDALGYFIARIAELTHMPSTKFSPYLMPP